MALRVTSAPFPSPTRRMRWALPPPGYTSSDSSRFPLKSPPATARASTAPPPAARSSSPSDLGRVEPWASAIASNGVSIWASGAVTNVLFISDMLDNALGKPGGRDLGGAGHLARQVVGDATRRDRAGQPAHDRVRCIGPAQLLEHHGAGEDHGPGVHLVEPGILRRRAVRCLEHRVPVAHVAARRHAQPADLRDARVGEVVAVQVGRREHRVLLGAKQHLLEHRVRDAVFDDHFAGVGCPLDRRAFRIVSSPNRSRATSYPHSRKAPSVNFMMFPLCTSVTDGRCDLIAYSIAFATRRWVPNRDIGLMPSALPSRILAPN